MHLVVRNLDLIFNIIGTLLIAFSFGKNLGGAYQDRKNLITKKTKRVYLASFVHPLLFKIGCLLLIVGFVITFFRR